MYSDRTKLICALILKWINLKNAKTEFKLKFSTANLRKVNNYITQHQNNVLKNILKQRTVSEPASNKTFLSKL